MTTKLEKDLKREVEVDGRHYTVTLSPSGLKITEKGHRKGHELTWKQIISGEAGLVNELAKSVDAKPAEEAPSPASSEPAQS